jgi:CheY-like chemotaxis protein
MMRVMVVDDDKVLSDTLTDILRACGYEARAFYDAETALSACENWTPEFVLTDVIMPGISGIEMAIEIKERNPSCKIVLSSGQAATRDLLETARSQGYHFDLLTKPVHPKDVLALLTRRRRRPPGSDLKTARMRPKAFRSHDSAD